MAPRSVDRATSKSSLCAYPFTIARTYGDVPYRSTYLCKHACLRGFSDPPRAPDRPHGCDAHGDVG